LTDGRTDGWTDARPYLDEGVDGLGGLEGPIGEVVEALHDVADGGEHAHAAVLQLRRAVPPERVLVLAVGQAQRVEHAALAGLHVRAHEAGGVHRHAAVDLF